MFKKLSAFAIVLLMAIFFSSIAMADASCPTDPTHVVNVVPGKAATCTEKGLTDGAFCLDCGKFLISQKDIPASHQEVDVPGKAATCTEKGLTDGKFCTVCNAFTVSQKDIPAEGHNEVTMPGKDATCTEKGYTEYVVCSTCNNIVKHGSDIPALGHNEVTMPGKDATCTEKGYTEYVVCTNCNNIVKHGSDIPALGHNEVTMPGKAATCTEKGYTEYVVCTNCNNIVEHGSDIPALGHTEKTMPGKDATCTEKGYTEYVVCTTCNQILVHGSDIPALGHTFEEGVCACGENDPDYIAPSEPEVPAEPETPVAPEESLYFYDNHFTSYGPSISELIGGNDWYRVTPVDLSEDGVYTYPLVAANRYTIGTVTFKVDTGSLTISYRITAWNVDVNEIELKIYGSKAAMAEGNAIVATIGEAINIGETFGNDTNVIVSLILTGNFDALATNVGDLVIVNAEIAEMIAAMD